MNCEMMTTSITKDRIALSDIQIVLTITVRCGIIYLYNYIIQRFGDSFEKDNFAELMCDHQLLLFVFRHLGFAG